MDNLRRWRLRRLLVPAVALPLFVTIIVAAATGSVATAGGDPVARALGHLKTHAKTAHFGADQELTARDVVVDANGAEHVRFDRALAGLRVIGGDLVAHTTASGDFAGVSETLAVDLDDVSRSAATSPGQAKQHAGLASGKTELVVYARGAKPRLAWEVSAELELADGTPSEPHVVVDALNGSVLDSWEGIEEATGTGNGFFDGVVTLQTTPVSGGYRLTDPTRGNQFTCDMRNRSSSCYYMTDADNVWGNGTLSDRASVAVDAQYGTGVTFDYYKNVFGRNGIANDGRGSYNRVHYGRNYSNAFWSDSCFCMTYGDGDGVTYNPFDSLDVAGHEMSHGVTSRTARLTYSGESGGLNEATSDIFGTMVEYYAANSKDTPDYKIGEKLLRSNAGETKALRYMYNPALDGKSANCWSSGVGALNVHYSSGVANHFYYLLAEGSSGAPASPTCNGSTVAGIGRTAAQAIWYRALTVYMTSNTNYHGARTASLNAARDLYGLGSAQYNAVNAAWAAVSVT